MRKLIILFFLSFSITANCQNYIDKIIITKNVYTARYNKSDSLYKSENKTITNKKAIFKILEKFKKVDSKNYLLSKYKIDTTFIKNNPDEILKLYSNKLEFDWNSKQKEFIFKELCNLNNYKKELDEYLDNGCCYTMHNFYKNEYVINFYKNSNLTNQLKSRKYVWGYKFPWSDNKGNLYFDYEIDKIIEKIFNEQSKITAPKKGEDLLKYLINEIIDNNAHHLYKLSPFTYENEINELKKEFEVISFEQIYAYGRYIGLEKNKVIKTTLHNEKMLPNVNLQFLASVDKSIYSKDTLNASYETIINRIQNINFIKNYLSKNSNSRIDVYFFNNKPINNYNIESINKNPTDWKKQDEYIESLKWYEKNNIKPSFNLKEAIKTSERNNCGCNFRFEKSFIEKGVFFEFFDEEDNSTIWILLPDNTVLLYIMDNEKALDLKLTEFEESYGIKFPCKLFNSDGIEIKK
jgi:hypothetical protein